MTGFKPWDDSPDVRKLFLKAEGGKTRVWHSKWCKFKALKFALIML